MTHFSHLSFVQAWILPPGINIFLMVIGLFIWLFSPRFGKLVIILSIVSLWLLSMPFVVYNMVDLLQNKYPMLQPDVLSKAQSNAAIVVLGGGDSIEAEYGNKHTVSDATLHRLNYAIYLHEKTNLPIIISGGKSKGSLYSEAELMTNYLRDRNNIVAAFKEDQSMTTADESKYLAPLLQKNKIQKIYLVTNAWHMPRSVFIFQCFGINVIPAPMGYYIYGPGYALISFLPNIDALYVSSIVIHEYIGLLWYQLKYGNQCIQEKT